MIFKKCKNWLKHLKVCQTINLTSFEISLQFFFWKLTIFENVILSESHKTEEIENIIFKTFYFILTQQYINQIIHNNDFSTNTLQMKWGYCYWFGSGSICIGDPITVTRVNSCKCKIIIIIIVVFEISLLSQFNSKQNYEKDVVLWIRTQGCRMEGTDESTRLMLVPCRKLPEWLDVWIPKSWAILPKVATPVYT